MNSKLDKDGCIILKEKFIVDYSKKRGWNPRELTSTQMIEIVSRDEYKNLKFQ